MKKILLSFDIEEFDLPREHGGEVSLEEGLKVSEEGLKRIIKVLDRNKVKATFFVTGNFAKGRPELVLKLLKKGHEVACHGVDHFKPKKSDIKESKKIVEKVINKKVYGYRQPRMGKINYDGLEKSGFFYDSSVNPAFIPGRYNNTKIPRKPFIKGKVLEIPVSVTGLRIPLFWLALHLFPYKLYSGLAKKTLRETGYFATYFHPWEYASTLVDYKEVPKYIKCNSGMKLAERLDRLIMDFKKEGGEFVTYQEFADEWYNLKKKG